jgi:Arc/MetJ-type ribon-helix-helix transcriptional regulator
MPKKTHKTPMRNITINIPDLYEDNIQTMIDLKLTASRSEAIRTAIREFLHREYDNLETLGFFNHNNINKNLIKNAGEKCENCNS